MKDLTFVWNSEQPEFKSFPQYLLFYDESFDRHKITNMADYWLPLTKEACKSKKVISDAPH